MKILSIITAVCCLLSVICQAIALKKDYDEHMRKAEEEFRKSFYSRYNGCDRGNGGENHPE